MYTLLSVAEDGCDELLREFEEHLIDLGYALRQSLQGDDVSVINKFLDSCYSI